MVDRTIIAHQTSYATAVRAASTDAVRFRAQHAVLLHTAPRHPLETVMQKTLVTLFLILSPIAAIAQPWRRPG